MLLGLVGAKDGNRNWVTDNAKKISMRFLVL